MAEPATAIPVAPIPIPPVYVTRAANTETIGTAVALSDTGGLASPLNRLYGQPMTTFLRILPWLILGPITGLLAEGVYRNIRASNLGLAGMYGVAMVGCWYDLAFYGGGAVVTLHRWFF